MNFNQLFSEVTLIKQLNVEDVLAAGAYPASGSYIDVSKYERFAFLVMAGGTTNAQTWKVQQATANNGTLKDVTDATVSIGTSGDDKWYLIEVQTSKLDINNGYKFVALTNVSGTTGDYAAVVFLGLNPGYAPVTQGADKGEIVSVVG